MRITKKLLLTASLITLALALTVSLDGTPQGGTQGSVLASAEFGPQPALSHAMTRSNSVGPSSTPLAKAITVSGTITGPSGPVKDVWVGAGSPQDWQEATTDASGFYRITLQTDGLIWIYVRPAIATRLAQVSYWTDGVNADRTLDFTLEPGHLLSVRVTGGGAPIAQETRLEVQRLITQLPRGYHYVLDWDPATGRYQAVFPSIP